MGAVRPGRVGVGGWGCLLGLVCQSGLGSCRGSHRTGWQLAFGLRGCLARILPLPGVLPPVPTRLACWCSWFCLGLRPLVGASCQPHSPLLVPASGLNLSTRNWEELGWDSRVQIFHGISKGKVSAGAGRSEPDSSENTI